MMRVHVPAVVRAAVVACALIVSDAIGCRTTPGAPEPPSPAVARFRAVCGGGRGERCDCCPPNARLVWCHPWTVESATCACIEDVTRTRALSHGPFSLHRPPQRMTCVHWYP